jgi:hypothetical protein
MDNQALNPTATKTNTSGDSIDITAVSNEDHDQLAQCIESFYKQEGSVKAKLSFHWDRNQRFLDGEQWLVFDGDRESGGAWKRLTVQKANEYIPRPVTNYIFDSYQTLKSYLIKNKPRSTVRPNTNASQDKSAAKIAELCLEANWERLQEQDNYEYAAACLVTYGTVFKKSYWDTTSANMVKIPVMTQRPKSDPQTGMVVGMEEIQAQDEQGQPLFDMIPLGDVNSRIVEPYRLALDPLATGLHNAQWVMEYAIQSLDWIAETYNKQAPGYTGRAMEVTEESNLSGSMRRYYGQKNSSGVKGADLLGGQQGSGSFEMTNSAVVKEYYERPSLKCPRGRLVVVANGICLYAGDSLVEGLEQGDWHPYSECRWEIVPGRFWGKSPLDNACEVQKHINSIDATVILTRKTMAIPQKITYKGSGINPGTWTGRPGQQLDVTSPQLRPEIIPAVGVDSQVFAERAQRVDDIKNITGAIDILKGDRPDSVSAASAINMLFEIGTGKLYPTLDRWKRFVENDQKKQLKLIARYYKEPREDYVRMLKLKNRDLSESVINKFIGADLYDNCNVVVEAGSNIPKLESAKQAQVKEAAASGTLNLDIPANRMEYNRQLGITGFDNEVGPDFKRAEWENDLLDNVMNSPDNAPIRLDVDEDAIHIEVHSRRMKEPSFMELPSEVQMAYMNHIADHQNSQAQKQQEQMMQAMAAGAPPPELPQPNGSSKMQKAGKGVPAKTQEAMTKVDMPPMTMK